MSYLLKLTFGGIIAHVWHIEQRPCYLPLLAIPL